MSAVTKSTFLSFKYLVSFSFFNTKKREFFKMIFPCGPVSRIDVVPAPVVFPDAAAFKLVWVKMLLV